VRSSHRSLDEWVVEFGFGKILQNQVFEALTAKWSVREEYWWCPKVPPLSYNSYRYQKVSGLEARTERR
jgi:hypothetical protein